MPKDAFTLNGIANELNDSFKGARVNKIYMPDKRVVYFSVYNGKKTEELKISVNPENPFVCIPSAPSVSLLTAPSFCMLLRKHLIGGSIENVKLVNFDRIIKIDFLVHREFKEKETYSLFVELMGRHSNCILTLNGKILGKIRGGDDLTATRPLITGFNYVPFSSADKFSLDSKLLAEKLKSFSGSLKEFFINNVSGVSVETAEFLANNLEEKSDKFSALQNFTGLKNLSPCVKIENGKVIDFYLFPYSHKEEYIYFDSVLKAQSYYLNKIEEVKGLNLGKQKLRSKLNAKIKKVEKRLSRLKQDLKKSEMAEEYKLKGELIMANACKIGAREKSVILENYYNGEKIKIELDEGSTPVQNANSYYKKYAKETRAKEVLNAQREEAESLLEYLNSISENLDVLSIERDLNFIESEMIESGLIEKKAPPKNAKTETAAPFRIFGLKDATLRVGKNNIANDRLCKSSPKSALWFHVKDYHSAHAVLEGETTIENIKISAEICAFYSKARESGKTEVAYTEVRNVKKSPKYKPGFVIYSNFKSIMVEPNNHENLLIND